MSRARNGSLSTKLFEPYQHSEKPLILGLIKIVVSGVNARKVKRITEDLCGRAFAQLTVNRLAKTLKAQVEVWNEQPVDQRAGRRHVDQGALS